MEFKNELEILQRNLKEELDKHATLIREQTLELNEIRERHIVELQALPEDNERAGVIKLQALEINIMKENHNRVLQQSSGEIKQYTKRIDDFCKLVEHYSYFDSKEIGEILAEVMTTLKGKKYIYQETMRYTAEVDGVTKKRIPLVIPYRIIIEEMFAHDSYLDDNISLDDIVEANMAVVLTSSLPFSERQISFYGVDEKEHTLIQLVDFEGFPVIKEFIDFLINYKLDNKVENLSLEKMHELKDGFIASKQIMDEKGQLVK